MTGYGQGSAELEGARVAVELRSVNNRFADFRLRMPPELASAEAGIRQKLRSCVRRGRVELSIKLEYPQGAENRVTLNRELLDEVLQAAAILQHEFAIESTIDRGTILAVPGMFKSDAVEAIWDDAQREGLHRALDQALVALDDDRRREGSELQRDLLQRVEAMKRLAQAGRERVKQVPLLVRDRLQERLVALAQEVKIDPARVAQEVAVLADRCDVTEELVRLAGHLDQAAALLGEPDGEPVGKRLEFLLQEIHRETNTLSSKSVDLELTRVALDLKLEAEKIREQVQNLE